MSHHHEHHHHHHHAGQGSLNGIFILSITLNLLFVIIEAGVGFWKGSLSLLSDAGHNLSDVFSLLLVLIGFGLAKMHSTKNYTYGLKKSTILISLLNALILLVAVGAIVVESVHKLREPSPIDGVAISWTAGVGIVINGATALLLMRGQKHDLNVRGAFLHMAADTLVSVGVVVSGIIIRYTDWYMVDPIVSLIIAVVILITTWDLLTDSLRLVVDGMPEGIVLEDIEHLITAEEGVKNIHHIHIWAISTTENALTAHVVIEDIKQMDELKSAIKDKLHKQGIQHCTLEFEETGSVCPDEHCC